MSEYAYLIKAKAKSEAKSLFCWFSAKSDSRADREIANLLEDAEIETGRGADYVLPVRTDLPVFDDLPEESELDATWCDRYELADDNRTWRKITQESTAVTIQEEHPPVTTEIEPVEKAADQTRTIDLPFNSRVVAFFLFGVFAVSKEELATIRRVEMDTDNSYVQNLILAANSTLSLKQCYENVLCNAICMIKEIWQDAGKTPDLNNILLVMKDFVNEPADRAGVKAKWLKKVGKSEITRTDAGTNAGGAGDITNLEMLDLVIASAILSRSMDIPDSYSIPGPVLRRAKEMVAAKESPWREWSSVLRKTAGVLDFERGAFFRLITGADPEIHKFPGTLQTYVNSNLGVQKDSEMPKVIATTKASADAGSEAKNIEMVNTQPVIKNEGNGIFSVAELAGDDAVGNTDKSSADAAFNENKTTLGSMTVEEIAGGINAINPNVQVKVPEVEPEPIDAEFYPEIEQQIAPQNIPETIPDTAEPPAPEYPAFFEPGRYEGIPNEVYHAANGISSTQVKDARVSLMYFNARHVEKTIKKERSAVLDMGNLVHALALEPEKLDQEFSIEPAIPDGAFTTTATIRAFIDKYNASLPAQLSADEIKALIEAHNATLPAQLSLGASVDETGQIYMTLPVEFQRIEEGQKQTAAAMKACIKEYNATLPAQIKTSGGRDALLEQLAIINPDMVAQEAQKPEPLKVSGNKLDLIQAVKAVNPEAIFADELLDAWRENPENKILVTHQQTATATAIQSALLAHPTAGKLLSHPDRSVEVSYFGFDEETGLEVRVRPDLEIDMDGIRIGADLKTISMWNVKQESLRAKLHREIIERDYHLSAAMYCETAGLDQFFWIFVNKDEGYHWIAIIEASAELLELGMLEYRKTMRSIANAMDTGVWPAPVVEDYTDELNDFDLRRLESLRAQA